MNHPKVYDAKGRVLEVGSRVSSRLGCATVTGFSIFTPNETGLTVLILVDGDSKETHYHAEPLPSAVAFRAPNLLLITDDEKGDAPQ